MIKTIVKLLKAHKEVSAYELNVNQKDSYELFYVGDKLETYRATDTSSISVTVYHDFDQFRGSASFTCNASDNEESISVKIADAVKEALNVKNLYFELSKPEAYAEKPEEKQDLKDIAFKVGEAIVSADRPKKASINSAEVFVSRNTHQYLNSNEVDMKEHHFSIFFEMIPNYAGEKEEVELYKSFETNAIDYEEIAKQAAEALKNVEYRALANPLKDKDLKVKVLISGEMRDLLLDELTNELSYSMQYMNFSHFKKGDKISDKHLDITLRPEVEGAYGSRVFDGYGTILKPVELVKDDEVVNYYGDLRYGYYLKEENITGLVPVVCLKPGERSIEEIKKEPYLEVLNFSAPQLDMNSGYFGGEIRLALYFDGKTLRPVSSLSIQGDVYEALKNLELSKETETYGNYSGPKYLVFEGINIL
jgi:predicted Zn-dependent protease